MSIFRLAEAVSKSFRQRIGVEMTLIFELTSRVEPLVWALLSTSLMHQAVRRILLFTRESLKDSAQTSEPSCPRSLVALVSMSATSGVRAVRFWQPRREVTCRLPLQTPRYAPISSLHIPSRVENKNLRCVPSFRKCWC